MTDAGYPGSMGERLRFGCARISLGFASKGRLTCNPACASECLLMALSGQTDFTEFCRLLGAQRTNKGFGLGQLGRH
jgi:hypothetical protein